MANAMLENSIQEAKDLIESRQFIVALQLIKKLECEYPSSALVLVLKALVYATIGDTKALASCFEAKEKIFTDKSVHPDVLNIFPTICQLLERNDLAIIFYKYACVEVPDSLGLKMELFRCYVRESSFENQLMICFEMYKLSREDKFLMWAVFSIQLQMVSRLVTKHATINNLDEGEALLVYMCVARQYSVDDDASAILSMLGTTLLICEVGRRYIKGDILLARLCDYAGAMEILRQKLEKWPVDWARFFYYLDKLDAANQWCSEITEVQIRPSITLACKLPQLSRKTGSTNEEFGTKLSDALNHEEFGTKLSDALKLKLNNQPMQGQGHLDGLDEARDEYFSRFGGDTKVTLQVSQKFEELQFINNLCGQDSLIPALQVEAEKFLAGVNVRSDFISDEIFEQHGTSIALKTDNFIVVAADGKLTTTNNSKSLNLKANKVRCLGDMCAGICGSWKTLSNTVGALESRFRDVKNEREERPKVGELADFLEEELSSCQEKSGVILGAFDKSEEGVHVPCISFVDECRRIDVSEPFFCSGTGEWFAKQILSKANWDANMSLDDAICLVERALVYASLHDNCTGGWANIYVIEVGKPGRAITREEICTTLWRRHRSSLPE